MDSSRLFAHFSDVPEESLDGNPSERDDNCGVDTVEFCVKVGRAVREFRHVRVTVLRRATSNAVRNANILPSKSSGVECFVEDVPRPSDERLARLVFIRPGRFAHKYDVGVTRADTVDNTTPRLTEVGTAFTGSNVEGVREEVV
jgi:hypothetical protein